MCASRRVCAELEPGDEISALSEDFFTSMKANGWSSPLETIKQSVNVGCPAIDGCNFTRMSIECVVQIGTPV